MNNLPSIRKIITGPAMQQMIQSRIGEKAGTFTTSVLDLIGDNRALQNCDPNDVIKEAIKAAALVLPIDNNLGFTYVIPYKNKPQFQMGYKGFVQLAIRTGQYKNLNADAIFEGETVAFNRLKGTMKITGVQTSNTPVGFFAYMALVNGFEKAIYWTLEEVTAHAKKFSKSFNSNSSPWKTDFPAMAKKTLLKHLISKYGPLTVEMTSALVSDQPAPGDIQTEIDIEANQEVIDVKAVKTASKPTQAAKPQAKEPRQEPGF